MKSASSSSFKARSTPLPRTIHRPSSQSGYWTSFNAAIASSDFQILRTFWPWGFVPQQKLFRKNLASFGVVANLRRPTMEDSARETRLRHPLTSGNSGPNVVMSGRISSLRTEQDPYISSINRDHIPLSATIPPLPGRTRFFYTSTLSSLPHERVLSATTANP